MTLTYEHGLKILKMYPCMTKVNLLGQGFQMSHHYKQTDRQTRPNALQRRIRNLLTLTITLTLTLTLHWYR